MAEFLRMPEVAANAVEAILQSWPIEEHAAYAKGDVIATVETEKAVVDVEAEADGVLLKTLVAEGAGVEVGAPIAVIGTSAEGPEAAEALLADLSPAADPPPADAPTPAPAAAQGRPAVDDPDASGIGRRIFSSPLARRMAKEAGLAVETIAGTGPNGRIVRRDVEDAVKNRATAPAPQAAPEQAPVPAQAAPVAALAPPSAGRRPEAA